MRIVKALKKLGVALGCKNADLTGDNISEVIEQIAAKHSVTLTSPDKSVWDISIANDGTISGTKRT